MKSRHFLAFVASAALLLASGCGAANTPNPNQQQPGQVQSQARNNARTNQNGQVSGQSKPFQAQSGTKQFKALGDPAGDPTGGKGDPKKLAGGPEKDHRVLRPMDNYVLQKKYPGILALSGPPDTNRIALTFDDGPDSRFTPQVLDVLKKHNVKATFFVMGSRVAGHPDVTKRIHEEGHVIGNHTYWHPKLVKEGIDRTKWEATQTDEAIRNVVGYSPKLFRPPYGGLNDELVTELGNMNYSIIGWSSDSLDWTQADAETVRKNVLSHLRPGVIILMHSGGDWTQDLSSMVKALDKLIPELKKDGFEMVTIPQLLNIPDRK